MPDNVMRRAAVALVFCAASHAIVFAQKPAAPGPESIDIFNPQAGSFLDIDLQAIGKQAFDAYQNEKYEQAARLYLTLTEHDISDGGSIYNLACCYGLLGRDSLAARYLERSVKAGFDDIEHARNDQDSEKVRKAPVFEATIRGLDSIAKLKQADLGRLDYVLAPALLRCRVHLPKAFDSTKAYPLVVGLHGYGDNLDHFITLWKRFGDTSFIFASPQAPYPFMPGKEIGYSWSTGNDSAPGALSDRMSEDYVVTVTNRLKQQYKVSDVYLMGFSQGCRFTYTTGIRNPGLYKGLICFGGWLDTGELRPELLKAGKGLKVFIAHGKQDHTVEYKARTESRDILKKHGYDVTFVDFEGGHTVKAEALQQAIPWMKK